MLPFRIENEQFCLDTFKGILLAFNQLVKFFKPVSINLFSF